MRYLISTTLVLVAIIHLLPLVGVTGAPRLAQMYGVDASEPNLQILMQHRAVLFGLLGCFLAYAALNPGCQFVAFFAGFVSVLSFILIALKAGDYNAHLSRVIAADWLALVLLTVGTVAKLFERNFADGLA
jgi:hypothetical protein